MSHPAKWIKATPQDFVTDVAKRSLLERLKPVQQYLPLAARNADADIEYVHQLRVWSRRAQAALEMYRELLPDWRAAWIEKQLRRIRGATNDARDDDVFIARLMADDRDPAAARLLERVRTHRAQTQQLVVEVHQRLKSKGRFDRRIAKLIKRIRPRGKQKGKKPKFGKWAGPRFRPVVNEFFEAGLADFTVNDNLHQFRILGKKLRYAMELLSSAFPDELKTEVYPLLAELQEKLGEINDHATAEVRMQFWIDEDEDQHDLEYLLDMRVCEHQQLLAKRAVFFAWWTPDRVQRMRRAFERALDPDTMREEHVA